MAGGARPPRRITGEQPAWPRLRLRRGRSWLSSGPPTARPLSCWPTAPAHAHAHGDAVKQGGWMLYPEASMMNMMEAGLGETLVGMVHVHYYTPPVMSV